MTGAAAIQLAIRCLLVLLFLPFSALDKIFNFRGAVRQANEIAARRWIGVLLICAGLSIEIVMSLAVITGIADRLAALVLAFYCIATACLWKQFWKPIIHLKPGEEDTRGLFWDFLKNFSLAGGFLLLAFGTSATTVREFIAHPFASSQPYHLERDRR
jgi:putative oxidoreductase